MWARFASPEHTAVATRPQTRKATSFGGGSSGGSVLGRRGGSAAASPSAVRRASPSMSLPMRVGRVAECAGRCGVSGISFSSAGTAC